MSIITDKEFLRKKFTHLTEEELETWLFWKGNDDVISGNPPRSRPGTIVRHLVNPNLVWVANDQRGNDITFLEVCI